MLQYNSYSIYTYSKSSLYRFTEKDFHAIFSGNDALVGSTNATQVTCVQQTTPFTRRTHLP